MSSILVLEAIFGKRGSDWTPQETKAVLEWLNESQQKHECLVSALKRLGEGANRQDAEDVWRDFIAEKLVEGVVIKNYDPARKSDDPGQEGRGPFWRYLSCCYKHFCYDEAEKFQARRHREEPLIDREFVDPDPNSDPAYNAEQEEARALLRSLAKSHPDDYNVLALFCFREMSHKEIALELGITEAASRVRLYRARQELRKYYLDR